MKKIIILVIVVMLSVVGTWIISGKTLSARKAQANLTRLWPPSFGYGRCGRCDRPWNIAKEHCTDANERGGMFPLCEPCWQELTPEKRLPYYKELYDRWGPRSHYIWQEIEKAVMEGK